jgi:glycosyltransferase involved in cell wall biosynthesis
MNKVNNELDLYRSFKVKAISTFNQNKFEESLDYVRAAALLAWQCHCGLWYDSELEILLRNIGRSLQNKSFSAGDSESVKEAENFQGKKIAYITSAVNVGGLTILLNQWINLLKNDFEEKVIYVTNSYTSKNPFYGTDTTFSDPEVKLYNLSHKKKYTDRIKQLIKCLNDISPDYIALFIDPDDIIAVSAVNALDARPKIIYVNHTDHAFWLGRNIMDELACFRKEGAVHAKQYRDIDNSFVIPISTGIKPEKVFSKEDFNIDKDDTISISVGTFPKVLGDKNPNYFHTITRLLEQFPDHHHFFITNPPDKSVLEKYLPDKPHIRKRFIIDGPFSNLSPYYEIADFLIETFPITGYTVQVEAMASKLPIVAFKNNFALFSSAGNLPSYPFAASTENEIIDFSAKLIKNSKLREELGNHLYNYYFEELNPEKAYESLKGMINHKSQNTYNNIKNKRTYDVEDVKMFTCRNFRPYKHLILQSILKESSFSVRERANFYYNALKRKEFSSKKEILGYLIPVISGRNPYNL